MACELKTNIPKKQPPRGEGGGVCVWKRVIETICDTHNCTIFEITHKIFKTIGNNTERVMQG